MSLWGGRFSGAQDPAFESFNRSLPFDKRLWFEDIEGSQAWARAHVRAGTLSEEEGERLVKALDRIRFAVVKEPSLLDEAQDEDIHSFVEAQLVADIGDLGKKLHSGRSRNDQVATDLRLFALRRIRELGNRVTALISALVDLAEREHATPLPGYTHLQRAQIITVGHHALAYAEMLGRDAARLDEARGRVDSCPLGSAALAGTSFPIDRELLADDLGFRDASHNSLDAVSDRDFVAELIFVATLSCAHLSRLAEDWIFYTSQEAGFVTLSDSVTTGSSLMPQKKNPDSLELIRGKGARVLGHLAGFLACLRSLPLAYDKDLQEDKEAFFDALDTWDACLHVARLVVQGATFDVERCRAACERGYLNATELAEHLVRNGVPFRDAHEQAGKLVRLGLERGKELKDLSLEELREVAPQCGPELYTALETDNLLAARTALGAANPRLVLAEVGRWRELLDENGDDE